MRSKVLLSQKKRVIQNKKNIYIYDIIILPSNQQLQITFINKNKIGNIISIKKTFIITKLFKLYKKKLFKYKCLMLSCNIYYSMIFFTIRIIKTSKK